ncbi:MAG: PRD domain-containing protein [Erysipelotrichaceae bacterium]
MEIYNQEIASNLVNNIANDYNKNYFFDDQSSRVSYLLFTFLSTKDYLKSQDLADEMYISKSRISSDLLMLKKIISKYNLKLNSKPYHGLTVIGNEIDKRQCLIKENLNFKYNIFDNNLINKDSNYEIINNVKNLVTQILVDTHYKVSDVSLQNLIVHIATAVERIKEGNTVIFEIHKLDNAYHHVYDIASKIIEKCCEIFDLKYSESEVLLLALNLHGKREYESQEYISDEINSLVYKGLNAIKLNYNIDLSNDLNLRIALALHIIPLLSRLKTGMLLKNIMAYNIKQNFTLAFDIGSTFANTILPEYKERLSDDELSYLALHFSLSLDNTAHIFNFKNILLVCAQKKSETILIQQKIKQWFNNINEIKVISKANILTTQFDEYNAILTTEPSIAEKYPRAKLINYFLNELDYKKIELALNGFNSTKDILDKFDKDLFYVGKAENKTEIIKILFEKAKNKYKLNNNLLDSIMLHEEIASSCFGNKLAIPHPEKLLSDSTFIAVAVLTNEIIWEENFNVNLVFLVSIERNSPKGYQLWYYLSNLISNKEALEEIHKSRSFDSLVSTVSNVYKDLF